MNTRRNETIGCNLVNGRGSRDEHWRGRGGRYSYITTKLRRIPNGLLGSNQRFPRPSSFLPFFHIYVTVAPVPGYFPASPCFERRVKKMESLEIGLHVVVAATVRNEMVSIRQTETALSFALKNYFYDPICIYISPIYKILLSSSRTKFLLARRSPPGNAV